jgi:hypothetical protein
MLESFAQSLTMMSIVGPWHLSPLSVRHGAITEVSCRLAVPSNSSTVARGSVVPLENERAARRPALMLDCLSFD